MSSSLQIRPLSGNDHDRITWALYAAIAWKPDRQLPPFETVIRHPELTRYYEGWGRPGDLGVVAELEGEFVGIAFYRLFTENDHGHGYVDADTPELAVVVVEDYRGRGIGTRLLQRLADAAQGAGFEALSLSVDAANPARRLYQRLGYREVSIGGGDVRMLLDLR